MNFRAHSIPLPPSIRRDLKIWDTLFLFFSFVLLLVWLYTFVFMKPDLDQGQVFKIMFIHVPVAWCAFFWIFTSAIFSCFVLFSKSESTRFDLSAQTCMELGVLFSILVLITGSIWGKPTWGVWWDWDPRLTSTLVMMIVASACLILRASNAHSYEKQKSFAMMNILCALNVPIVYYSVNLWRSLHQPQTFVRSGGNNTSSDVTVLLVISLFCVFFLSICMYKIRRQSISALVLLDRSRSEQGG